MVSAMPPVNYIPHTPRVHSVVLRDITIYPAARLNGRLSRRACQNGLACLAEFEIGCAGLDGLTCGLA
jgi:hypothetical protein